MTRCRYLHLQRPLPVPILLGCEVFGAEWGRLAVGPVTHHLTKGL